LELYKTEVEELKIFPQLYCAICFIENRFALAVEYFLEHIITILPLKTPTYPSLQPEN